MLSNVKSELSRTKPFIIFSNICVLNLCTHEKQITDWRGALAVGGFDDGAVRKKMLRTTALGSRRVNQTDNADE